MSSSRDLLGLGAIFVSNILVNKSGIGGGGIMIPILLIILQLDSVQAVALSNLAVLAGAATNFYSNDFSMVLELFKIILRYSSSIYGRILVYYYNLPTTTMCILIYFITPLLIITRCLLITEHRVNHKVLLLRRNNNIIIIHLNVRR